MFDFSKLKLVDQDQTAGMCRHLVAVGRYLAMQHKSQSEEIYKIAEEYAKAVNNANNSAESTQKRKEILLNFMVKTVLPFWLHAIEITIPSKMVYGVRFMDVVDKHVEPQSDITPENATTVFSDTLELLNKTFSQCDPICPEIEDLDDDFMFDYVGRMSDESCVLGDEDIILQVILCIASIIYQLGVHPDGKDVMMKDINQELYPMVEEVFKKLLAV